MFKRTAHDLLEETFSAFLYHVMYVELGLVNITLTDYLSEMLSSFNSMSDIYRFKNRSGTLLTEPEEILEWAVVEDQINTQEREKILYNYIADLSLFLVGFYPVLIDHEISRYTRCGKNSYFTVSDLSEPPRRYLLHDLGESFEVCSHALGLLNKHMSKI